MADIDGDGDLAPRQGIHGDRPVDLADGGGGDRDVVPLDEQLAGPGLRDQRGQDARVGAGQEQRLRPLGGRQAFVQFLASGAQATYPDVEPPPANDLSGREFEITPGPVPLLPNLFVD